MGCAASQEARPIGATDGVAKTETSKATVPSAEVQSGGMPPGDSTAAPKPVEAAAAAPGNKPKPMPFAIMRNGHEVLRGGVLDCSAALEAGRTADFLQAWTSLHRWAALHARMEEGVEGVGRGFFPFLNLHFDSIADPLLSTHKTMDALEEAVSVAARNLEGSAQDETLLAAAKDAFGKFAEANADHLSKEEEVMMPKVMELGKSGHNLKAVMADDLLPCVPATDMDFFLQHAMRALEKHHGGQPRARVFAHAIYAVASEEQWKKWKPSILSGLSSDLYNSIAKECGF